ncbi:MAG: DUF6800 family protein [Pirellulales bacterium]
MGLSERHKEIKRRRHRKQKVAKLTKRVAKATVSEKAVIADTLRNLTPGAGHIISKLDLEKR